jgi:hypothetical protein
VRKSTTDEAFSTSMLDTTVVDFMSHDPPSPLANKRKASETLVVIADAVAVYR